MIESASWLKDNAALLGINPEHINGHTADLALGHMVFKISENGSRNEYSLQDGQRFLLKPRSVYLFVTGETLTRVPGYARQLMLKPELAYVGIQLLNAGLTEEDRPSAEGPINRCILALQTLTPLEVKVGQRVAQVAYHRLDIEATPNEHLPF